MNDFLLGMFSVLFAAAVIVLVKLSYSKLDKDDELNENFINTSGVTALDLDNDDKIKRFPKIKTKPEIAIDNTTNYPAEKEYLPEIYLTPRLSSFKSYIRD